MMLELSVLTGINMDSSNNKQNLSQSNPESSFTKFTLIMIEAMAIVLIRSLFLYLLWNYGIVKELGLQELSYSFFVASFIFLQSLFYFPETRTTTRLLTNIDKNLAELYNVTFFDVTQNLINRRNVVDSSKKVDNGLDTVE